MYPLYLRFCLWGPCHLHELLRARTGDTVQLGTCLSHTLKDLGSILMTHERLDVVVCANNPSPGEAEMADPWSRSLGLSGQQALISKSQVPPQKIEVS